MAGLKTEREIRLALSRRLSKCYAEDVAELGGGWPYVIPLGHPSKQALLDGLADLAALTQTLRTWDERYGTTTAYAIREAGGPKRVPTHVSVPSADVAAELATQRGQERWPLVLRRTRERYQVLLKRFPNLRHESIATALRQLDGHDDLECDLVFAAASWFAAHDAHGIPYRQVPIPGIDSKWLQNKRRCELLCLLSGKEELGLVGWPPSVEFAYLDPKHQAAGGRHYDSWVRGDTICLPYAPRLVVIVENKDTYLSFPALDSAICVFGAGFSGVSSVAALPWLHEAHEIAYWGDLDADGFEILNAYRTSGLKCRSILMDVETLERYGRYGTNLEKDHRTQIHRARKELALLTTSERAAYELITDSAYRGNRRLEQERIPLSEAIHALVAHRSEPHD